MKKCIVKVVNYLRNEKQVLIVDKDPSGEIGVKYLMNDEKNVTSKMNEFLEK